MKKLLLIFICGCLFSIIATAQQITEPFGFPVKPGTKEWSKLKTEKERFNAMQIPEDILLKMSTQALVVSCLNFPAFGFITAYDNIQTGLVILAGKFNGLKELAKRKDAEKCLLEIYKITGINGFEDHKQNLNEKYWTIKFSWIELLLAQKIFIESLDTESKKELLALALEKSGIKKKSNEVFSTYGLLPTVYLMANVLHSIGDNEFEKEYSEREALRNFIKTSECIDIQVFDRILELAKIYLNKQN